MRRYLRALTVSNLLGESLILLGSGGLGLGAHDTSTPGTTVILELLKVVSVDGGDEGGETRLVLITDLGEGNGGGGLLVDEGTETRLALDNAVGDTHLAAESRKPEDELNGVNIIGNDDKGGLLGLDKGSNVVDTVLDKEGLLTLGLGGLALGLGGGGSIKTSLLVLAGLGAVLGGKLEHLGGSVLVKDLGELVDGRRDLETELEDAALTLETDVLGPLGEAGKITLGLNVLANDKGAGTLLDHGVLGHLLGGGLALGRKGGRGGLLGGGLGTRLEVQ